MNEKPTMGVEERLLLVSELMEAPVGDVAENELRKSFLTRTRLRKANGVYPISTKHNRHA